MYHFGEICIAPYMFHVQNTSMFIIKKWALIALYSLLAGSFYKDDPSWKSNLALRVFSAQIAKSSLRLGNLVDVIKKL